MRRCAILSAAGAKNPRKSDGVIHDGTAKTPNTVPSKSSWIIEDVEAVDSSSSWEGLLAESLKTCTTPSGRLVDPDFVRVCGTKTASAKDGLTYMRGDIQRTNLDPVVLFLSPWQYEVLFLSPQSPPSQAE